MKKKKEEYVIKNNKKIIIGILVIIGFILVSCILNDNDKKRIEKNLNNYPEVERLKKDFMEYFERITLNGKKFSEFVIQDKLKLDNIKYEKTNNELYITFDLIYVDEITMNKKIKMIYGFNNEKWNYKNSITDIGSPEYYITNCNPELKDIENKNALDYLKDKYQEEGSYNLIDTKQDKDNKVCTFTYEVETKDLKDTAEISLDVINRDYTDNFEYNYHPIYVKTSNPKTFNLTLNKVYKWENSEGGSSYIFRSDNTVETSSWAIPGGGSDYIGTYEIKDNNVLVTLTKMGEVDGTWSPYPENNLTTLKITSSTSIEESGRIYKIN